MPRGDADGGDEWQAPTEDGVDARILVPKEVDGVDVAVDTDRVLKLPLLLTDSALNREMPVPLARTVADDDAIHWRVQLPKWPC